MIFKHQKERRIQFCVFIERACVLYNRHRAQSFVCIVKEAHTNLNEGKEARATNRIAHTKVQPDPHHSLA